MKFLITTILIISVIPCISAQNKRLNQNKSLDACVLLNGLLKQSYEFELKKEFIKSLNKLYSARIAARNCDEGKRTSEVDQRIESVAYEINKQREDAIKSKEDAEKAKKIAEKARDDAFKATQIAVNATKQAESAKKEANKERDVADKERKAAVIERNKADSSARVTEASRLRTLASQFKDDDPTLALQLIKKACDTSYFNYKDAVTLLKSILTTHPASFYLTKFEKKDDDVSSAVMSESGQYLIIGGNTGSIDVWNLAETSGQGMGKRITTRAGHTGAVLSLATSGDGEIVVSGSIDGTIYRWDKKLEKQSTSFSGHTGAVLSVAISADKRFLVSSGEDKMVNIWNLGNGTLEKKLTLKYGNAIQVCFSPDGKYVGIAGNDEVILVWDWQLDKVIATLEGHLGAVRSVAFAPDGNQIVSGGDDKTVKVWDWKTSIVKHTLQGHQSSVTSVDFSSDMRNIVSASPDKTIKVWDIQNTQLIRELRGHQKGISVAGFFKDSRYIYSGSYDGSVKLWDWKQDHMVNPNLLALTNKKTVPTSTEVNQRHLISKTDLFSFAQSDTTKFNQNVVTQGADNTIWLWDSTASLKPVYVIYNGDAPSLPIDADNSTIKSTKLYQAFYQKLIRLNGKLIPSITAKDQSKFFGNSQ